MTTQPPSHEEVRAMIDGLLALNLPDPAAMFESLLADNVRLNGEVERLKGNLAKWDRAEMRLTIAAKDERIAALEKGEQKPCAQLAGKVNPDSVYQRVLLLNGAQLPDNCLLYLHPVRK